MSQIIDLLEKIENARTVTGPTDERLSVILELKEIAGQALTLLKQQQTAGEIADKLRNLIANAVNYGRATGYLLNAGDIDVLKAARDYLDAVKS